MAVDLASLIVDVPDFPRPGIGFKDITPLLASPDGLAAAVDGLVESAPDDVDVVVGLEARGFLFGPVGGAGPGRGLRSRTQARQAAPRLRELSPSTSSTARTRSPCTPTPCRPASGSSIVDDVLATGGTVAATVDLVQQLGAEVAGVAVVLELDFLPGRARLTELGLDVRSLVRFERSEPDGKRPAVHPAYPPVEPRGAGQPAGHVRLTDQTTWSGGVWWR